MIADMLIHAGLGCVLGVQFAAAALLKKKLSDKKDNGKSRTPLSLYFQNILFVLLAFVSLVIIMKFVRNYQPSSWANLIVFVVSAVAFGYGCWRLLICRKKK